MPAGTVREAGAFRALLITVLFAKRPISGFDRKYGDTCVIKNFGIVAATGALWIQGVKTRVGGCGNTATVGQRQRPVAG